jgi:predicted dehydrogenase
VKTLICGLGSIGRRHLRHLAALGETDILLYRTGKSSLPDEDLAAYPVETDLAAALAHKPDAVIIANPTALHLDVAIPAAQAGCHILLEKPISNDLARVDQLSNAAEKSGSRILVGFQFRYHPALEAIRNLLSNGEVGLPVSVSAHYGDYLPDWHPWEDYRRSFAARRDLGGGVILTLTHPLDYLRWLFGDVHTLSAEAGQYSDLELDVEDTAQINLKFKAGILGSVHLDYVQRPPRHGMEIICTGGTILWDHLATQYRLWTVEHRVWQERSIAPNFERDHLFRDQMQHFLAVVRGEQKPRCTLADGVWVQRLALAAHAAARTGQRVEFSD